MIEIPQYILNKFKVREDYLEWIDKETIIVAYLDLTNMFYWQDVLGWKFHIGDLIKQLFDFRNIKEVKVYYGLNKKKKDSKFFHNRIRKTGAILRSKPMKFIKKEIDEALFFKRRTITLFDEQIKDKISRLVDEL